MKDIDNAIDQVLTALNTTEAIAGLEGRILRRMQASSSERTARGKRWRRKLLPGFAAEAEPTQVQLWVRLWGMAGAGLIAALLLMGPFISFHRGRPHPAAPVVQRTTAQPAQLVRPLVHLSEKPGLAPIKLHDGPFVSRNMRPHLPATTVAAAPQDSMAALAWSETLAPSRPAPPLPLTDQEKLFQRVVHRGNPVEMAELDPAARAAVAAREQADFRAFFKSSPQGNAPESH